MNLPPLLQLIQTKPANTPIYTTFFLAFTLASALLIACSGKTTDDNKAIEETDASADSTAGASGNSDSGLQDSSTTIDGASGSGGAAGSGGYSGGSGAGGNGGSGGDPSGCVPDPNCTGKAKAYCVENVLYECASGQNCATITSCQSLCNGCGCHVAPPDNGILRATCDTCQNNSDCQSGTVCGPSPVLPDSAAKGCVMGN